jgi:hypothetical protein
MSPNNFMWEYYRDHRTTKARPVHAATNNVNNTITNMKNAIHDVVRFDFGSEPSVKLPRFESSCLNAGLTKYTRCFHA